MISVIVPTTDDNQLSKLEHSLLKLGLDFEFIPIYNATSFFDCWQKGVKSAKGNYLMLTHQDTEYHYIPDLNEEFAFEEGLGMVGVAGSKTLDSREPWWFSTNRLKRGELSGKIYHDGEEATGLSVFGPYGKVRTLDGVCLITPKETLLKVGIPNYDWCTWDYYDHVICEEYIRKNYYLKTVPILMTHRSAGGDKRPSFFKAQSEFIKKYI